MNNDIRQQAPDYAEPIVGVRAWLVDEDGFLSSMTMREERWMPGEEKKASCGYPGSSDRHVSVGGTDPPGTVIEGAEHIAPQRGCACGLYAFYDRRTYEEYGDGFSLTNYLKTLAVSYHRRCSPKRRRR